jgi:hypothetical protein
MNDRLEYQYDHESGIFTGEKINHFAPVETIFYKLPFCILVKPEIPEGSVAVINADKTGWEYKPDNSGDWYGIETKEKTTLKKEDFDKDTSGLTRKSPPDGSYNVWDGSSWVADNDKKLAYVKAKKTEEILSSFDTSIINGAFHSESIGIDVDCRRGGTKNDYQNAVGLLSIMKRDGIPSVAYVGITEKAEATQDQIQKMIYEMEDHVSALYQAKWYFLQTIESATTEDQVAAVEWK